MVEMYLIVIALVGFLAFFEPCTIATHTLFAVRAHNEKQRKRRSEIFILFASRTILSILLTVSAVLVLLPPEWNYIQPEAVFLFLSAIYIISRFSYIPIPHLNFSKLLPAKARENSAVELGLTLPACTIPLFIVVIGLTVSVQTMLFAVAAGLLYSVMFTLPTYVIVLNGATAKVKKLFDTAGKISPFITSALFLFIAAILLISKMDLSIEHIKSVLLEPSFGGILIGFVSGLIFSFNPVSFSAIPVMLAYAVKAEEKKRALLMGIFFVAGMVFAQTLLGVVAALGGEWIRDIMGRFWGVVLGPVLIILGFIWVGWLKLRLPWFGIKGKRALGLWGAFILGIPFSVAVCPFCSPALLVMLTASAGVGSVPFGFFLLLAFSLGRGTPILIGAWSMGWLESLKAFTKYQTAFELFAGIILIVSGVYLLNEYFFIIVF